ncbi:glycosyltransferase [Aestuariicoccus sp. MJ-SS9]|uniref:glycosyltransferase n=1 Tax=Aestuariicoccus sp. MJ-SS9 TaxID=3079855 RepID=UPI00290863D8|nr:glycosyltransferase [Aestuariicoccus sp. MJ-SS9]MDU8913817.1 glycosyltransferase [Aestuariicoccus sp. MJ-SS9]
MSLKAFLLVNAQTESRCFETSQMAPDNDGDQDSDAHFRKLIEDAIGSLEVSKAQRDSVEADPASQATGVAKKPDFKSVYRDVCGSRPTRAYDESAKVFADPSRKREWRAVSLAMTFLLAICIWVALFVAQLLSQEKALAHASDVGLKIPGLPVSELTDGWSDPQSLNAMMDGTESHADTSLQTVDCGSEDAQSNSHWPRLYTFLPQAMPWAGHALEQSCDAISVLLPEWYSLGVEPGRFVLTEIEGDHKKRQKEYIEKRKTEIEVLPVITLDQSAIEGFQNPKRADLPFADLPSVLNALFGIVGVAGFCLDLSSADLTQTRELADILQSWSDDARKAGFDTCLALSGRNITADLRDLSESVDTVIMKVFHEPWIGSLPGPLATQDWFIQTVEQARTFVGPEKLVIAIGAGAVDWISSQPKPVAMSYAAAMTELALARSKPMYDSNSGNSFSAYVDNNGARHRIWILDAASFHNHRTALAELGVKNLALWSLGQEDPGIWNMLQTDLPGVPQNIAPLRNVAIGYFSKSQGAGPFVQPISLAREGRRNLEFDSETGLVSTVNYESVPQSAIVKYYGAGQPNQIVLTFDDGPHPVNTAKILDILKAENVPGSFFVLGQNAARHPELLERIFVEGHEIGSHTYYHSDMNKVSAARAKAEVNSVQMLVGGVLGHGMLLYRDPYMHGGGWLPGAEIPHLKRLSDAGYIISGMDVVPRDWSQKSSEGLLNETMSLIVNGGGNVLLLHDGGGDHNSTVEALPMLIAELKARGYEFVSLSDLLNVPKEALMPVVDIHLSTFNNVAFNAIAQGWTAMTVIFWTVLAVGLLRSVSMLVLAVMRKRHAWPLEPYTPSVAVIIPAYNEAKVISRSIESVLASNYPNLQVVVVDDGSRDLTGNLARQYETDPRVRVLHQPNRGKSAALNFGLDETDSEVFVCIDADSQVHPEAILRMVRHFADPGVGAVAGKVVVGNRTSLLARLQCLEYITTQNIDRRAKETMNAIPVVPGAIGAWRSTALLEAGIYNSETMTEDADMTMSVIRSGYDVVFEETAIATTEVPSRLRDLILQRQRWSLGMLQTCWKHAGAAREGRALGLLTIPDLAIFGYLMPLLAPIADLFLLIALYSYFTADAPEASTVADVSHYVLIAYLALPLIDLVTLAATFAYERKESLRLLWLVPLQRVFYRQILYFCAISAFWRAISGRLVRWNKIKRVGHQFEHAELA